MSWKIEKIEKNPFFCEKSYFFWLNLFCIRSQLSFEVYNSSVAQNLKFWPFLAWNISFFTFVIQWPIAPKLYYIGGWFWCQWKAKHQNTYLRATFGLLVAPKLRKRVGAIMAPSHVDTSFQIPCGIGLSYKNVTHLKRKLTTCRIQIHQQKTWFVREKIDRFRSIWAGPKWPPPM